MAWWRPLYFYFSICNRVIIINKGKIVADDKTEVIQQKTQPNSTLEVEFESEVSTALLKTLPGITRIESQGTNKFKLISPAGTDLRSDLFAFAVANNLKVLTLQKTESSLEDVFHQLTAGKN